jgi:hypothetical protein
VLCALVVAASACSGEDEKRSLEPVQVGMTSDMEASYDDGELQLFEVKRPVQFPIAEPSQAQREAAASKPVPPFPRYPLLTNRDIEVQVSWTLSNLDEQAHNVDILIDPWNEFGRYVPGVAPIDDDEFAPNLSGIQIFMQVPGTKDSGSSRRHGLFTFEDMNELAIDFATAMNILANPPQSEGEENGTVSYVNHVFAREQRSTRDALGRPFIPGVIPGLTGIDIGLRSREPANVAIEVVVEVVDKGSGKVLERGSDARVLAAPTEVVTIGN